MTFLHKMTILGVRQYPLYIVTFLITSLASLRVNGLPFKWLSPFLGDRSIRTTVEPTTRQLHYIAHISLAVQRIAKFTPWRCKCFEQGLTAKFLLQLVGIKSTLVFGVTYDADVALLAHAWLKCGSVVVTGANGADQFKEIAVFT